ncbi:MAG: type IV secretion protein DotN [Rhodospirillales bacterium]|nr:type IV secretion protein DotN [Alphaproteobacteria bacterium]MCB9986539.1 type IV secretion protein DotN [Rhodospirillales bacterium]USO06925.1 MAG: type IV secretion protein DotN [Rhodospirillales bacterium]
MPFLPIIPGLSGAGASAKAGGSTAGPSALGVEVPDEIRASVLERDGHACRYCGFTARKYQLVRLRGERGNVNNPDHLATACIFCDQVFALDRVATMKSGVLIWMPELDQAMLHHVARAIYVARISQGAVADAARRTLEAITARRDEAKNRIKTDDPAVLAMVLREYIDPRAYKNRGAKLEGIRLFPLDRRIISEGDLEFNQFPQILAYWRSKDGPFGAWQPAQWLEEFKQLKAA